MANLINGKRYRIVNTVEQSCLDIPKGSSNGTEVVGDGWGGFFNQCWYARLNSPNTFQFAVDNQPTPNVTYVLDASQTSLGEVCLYTSRASPNQLWTIEPIKPSAFLCFVKSVCDGRVLQYMGTNQRIHVCAKDAGNSNQHWVFEELEKA